MGIINLWRCYRDNIEIYLMSKNNKKTQHICMYCTSLCTLLMTLQNGMSWHDNWWGNDEVNCLYVNASCVAWAVKWRAACVAQECGNLVAQACGNLDLGCDSNNEYQ